MFKALCTDNLAPYIETEGRHAGGEAVLRFLIPAGARAVSLKWGCKNKAEISRAKGRWKIEQGFVVIVSVQFWEFSAELSVQSSQKWMMHFFGGGGGEPPPS